jgi:HSP20 family protein
MNDDTKKFFAELAGVEEEEPRARILPDSDEYHSKDARDLSDEREGQLTIDVYQTADALIVEAPIAGVKGDDIDVNITPESVTIRGKRERVHTVKEDDYFYQECYWGRFARSVILPEEVDADNAEATIKNGVLRIVMPKATKQKSKKLKVKNS